MGHGHGVNPRIYARLLLLARENTACGIRTSFANEGSHFQMAAIARTQTPGVNSCRWIKVTSYSLQASLQQGRETPDETLHCLIVEAGAIPSPPRLDLLNAARPR